MVGFVDIGSSHGTVSVVPWLPAPGGVQVAKGAGPVCDVSHMSLCESFSESCWNDRRVFLLPSI